MVIYFSRPFLVTPIFNPGYAYVRCKFYLNEKALRGTQTLRAGCSIKGGVKNFRPAADPLPGGAGRPKFNQLEMVTTFTYKPS